MQGCLCRSLEKVCHSKEAFMFPTSSKYNGFDIANQIKRTSYIWLSCIFHIFHHFPPFSNPTLLSNIDIKSLFYCMFVECGLQPFWDLTLDTFQYSILINTQYSVNLISETHGFQLWKNAGVFLCPEFFKSMPQDCFLSCAGRSPLMNSVQVTATVEDAQV